MEKCSEKIRYIANHYGLDNQLEKTKEELNELLQAIEHYQASGMTTNVKNELIDEIADVLVMCRQLEYLISYKVIGDRVKFKLDRQIERITNEINNN